MWRGPRADPIGGCGTVLATTLIVLASAGPAAADVFVVDRTDDDANANACTTQNRDCTLRGAVSDANAMNDADTITLPAGRIVLATDLPFLSGPTTIAGAGARASIIDGAGHVEQVIVGMGDTKLQDLTITGESLPGSGAVVGNSLMLERVALVDNWSTAQHGAGEQPRLAGALGPGDRGHSKGECAQQQRCERAGLHGTSWAVWD